MRKVSDCYEMGRIVSFCYCWRGFVMRFVIIRMLPVFEKRGGACAGVVHWGRIIFVEETKRRSRKTNDGASRCIDAPSQIKENAV